MPQAAEQLAITDEQTQNNSQNTSPTSNEQVTLKLRKYILMLASLVVTVTYAAAFNPPGDVWQDTAAGHIAGDPIIRDTHHKRYVAFFYCNATAFAASLVVIVLVLILASLDDKESSSTSRIVSLYRRNRGHAVRPLQLVMVVDLFSLMGAYAAGTCRDTFTTVYSSVLVVFVFLYVVGQVAWAHTGSCGLSKGQDQDRQPDDAAAVNPHQSGSGGGLVPEVEEEEERHPVLDEPETVEGKKRPKLKKVFGKVLMMVALAPASSNNPQSSSRSEATKDKAQADYRLRKVLMLLATFAVSITYLAGLSTPGGFWDTAGAGHLPGDAILKDRHNTRLAVFFGFNTMAFGASLLIIVVLLDTKLRPNNAKGFIVVALVSLFGAYIAGSCRQTDTTVKVAILIAAVLVYISFFYLLANHMHTKWKAIVEILFRKKAAEPERKPTDRQEAATQARSLVLLLATLAATITYQAGLDPPGGVWQDNSGGHTAGDPILLTTNPRRYKVFFYCNSVSLVASLVAIVLAQKQLLLKHHVLEAVMILDLFGLIGAYAAGSCRDVNTSIHAMALAGAVLVYVVIHVIFITLDDDAHTRTTDSEKEKENEKEKGKGKGKDDVMELVEKTRKRLLLFAIFVATITYQAGLTPPGGFLLQDNLQSGREHHAGDPVLLYNFPRRYKAFFYCNSVSFMLSIALIILLVNPNVYRPAIRTHALSVCTAAGLFGLMGSYAAGSTQHLKTSVYVFVLIAVVLVCIAILFLVFLLTSGGGGTKAQGTAGSSGDTADAMEAGTQVVAPTIGNGSAAAAAAEQGAAMSVTANTQLAVASKGDTATTQGGAMETGTQVVAPTISNSNAAAAAGQGAGIIQTTNTQVAVASSNNNTSSTQNNKDGVDNKTEHANRKYLMVLGILVASVTYQAGLEPPGGAWQSSSGWYEAGNPVMHDNRRPRYLAFFYSNSTLFMASIVVILLLLVPPEKLIDTAGKNGHTRWIEKIIGTADGQWRKKWLVVMNTTIVLDLLGLLGAYAAGSSRRWKTTVYVLLLVIGVLVYMALHYALSCIIKKKNDQSSQQQLTQQHNVRSVIILTS